MDISIIIPVLNESDHIQCCLEQLLSYLPKAEIIVVDGGSDDNTYDLVTEFPVILCETTGGRAQQMNQGAAIARGDILLFLHCDTQLPDDFLRITTTVMGDPQVVAGAFPLQINDSGWQYRLLEKMIAWRSHLFALPYGDQAIFMRRQDFHKFGGYAPLPIMEDYELIMRIKKHGEIRIAASAVRTSARRWQKLGLWRTTWINQKVILGYHFGIPIATLRHWYNRPSR